jgi:hypothetical protein
VVFGQAKLRRRGEEIKVENQQNQQGQFFLLDVLDAG